MKKLIMIAVVAILASFVSIACDQSSDTDYQPIYDNGTSPDAPNKPCIPDNDNDGFSSSQGDCDDNNPAINPRATEILCDGIDQNCNGLIDDDQDADGDSVSICTGDCDDSDPTIYPGADELCDGLDNNCDGQADATCGEALFSLPEYDGYFSVFGGYPVTFTQNFSGGLIEDPYGDDAYQWGSAVITFDLSSYTGDWTEVSGANLKVYFNNDYPPMPDPNRPALPGPVSVTVRFWDLQNDYTNLTDCQETSTYSGGQNLTVTTTPEGCRMMPVQSIGATLFELEPQGDGWYSLLTEADQLTLEQLLQDHAGEKITLAIDWDTTCPNCQWYYIMDENPHHVYNLGNAIILAPPTLMLYSQE